MLCVCRMEGGKGEQCQGARCVCMCVCGRGRSLDRTKNPSHTQIDTRTALCPSCRCKKATTSNSLSASGRPRRCPPPPPPPMPPLSSEEGRWMEGESCIEGRHGYIQERHKAWTGQTRALRTWLRECPRPKRLMTTVVVVALLPTLLPPPVKTMGAKLSVRTDHHGYRSIDQQICLTTHADINTDPPYCTAHSSTHTHTHATLNTGPTLIPFLLNRCPFPPNHLHMPIHTCRAGPRSSACCKNWKL